jgi:hypothetical protein
VSAFVLISLLGLAEDHEDSKEEKMEFWKNFNHAWLVTLQDQYRLANEMIPNDQSMRNSDAIIGARTLKHLARKVVQFCDNVEVYGLVDYEMGFWEEPILGREFFSIS